jgi:sugar phosphate isomerase/epimerase
VVISESSDPGPVRVPPARVALSTASVYPESTATAFELGASIGYDAVEVMIGLDPVSQDVEALRQLIAYHDMPVCSVHAPCLLITQRVWGSDPWVKLERSVDLAVALDARTVVVHPPFRWQRDYAKGFVEGVAELESRTGVAIAVENMYPWRASRRELQAYLPGWNPVEQGYANVTLDLSHCAVAGVDALEMMDELEGRLWHVHMTDATGSARDEHLVPGRGGQPCAEVLERLADRDFEGDVVLEINTRRAPSHASRLRDLEESLAFTRLWLAAPAADFATSRGTARRPTQR